jgi:hypothetical protein
MHAWKREEDLRLTLSSMYGIIRSTFDPPSIDALNEPCKKKHQGQIQKPPKKLKFLLIRLRTIKNFPVAIRHRDHFEQATSVCGREDYAPKVHSFTRVQDGLLNKSS